ncbi:hypothetical protein AKO1_012293 [Acrasis kona]|uniref:RWP-RK domain-containing protein n=1 Tax=Acrasis kona TaxID=1008807 RepID=A0AAW2ZA39_9EUKA
MTTHTKSFTFVDSCPTSIKKKSKSRRVQVDTKQILECMHLSQNEACKELNISLSTLKRRYYELNIGKWPNHKQDSKQKPNGVNKADISFIMNKHEPDNTSNVSLKSDIKWIQEALDNFQKESADS